MGTCRPFFKIPIVAVLFKCFYSGDLLNVKDIGVESGTPTSCGNPSSISENVWYIESYNNKPLGAVMTVCAQPIPNGWVKISGSWNPTMCGSPSSIQDNVIQIMRLN